VPWNLTGGTATRLDVFYDVDPATGALHFSDPSRNFWRIQVTAEGLGPFTVVRPLTNLWSDSEANIMGFTHLVTGYESFVFEASFAPDGAGSFPLPPFKLDSIHIDLEAGKTFFDWPHMGRGYGVGGFNHYKAEIVTSTDLNPVPEPSTYALAALALLLGLVLRSSMRQLRRAPPGAESIAMAG